MLFILPLKKSNIYSMISQYKLEQFDALNIDVSQP